MDITNFHKIGHLLDPRKRTLKIFDNENDKEQVKNCLFEEMKLYNEQTNSQLKEPPKKIQKVQNIDCFNNYKEGKDFAPKESLKEYEKYFNSKFKEKFK